MKQGKLIIKFPFKEKLELIYGIIISVNLYSGLGFFSTDSLISNLGMMSQIHN